MAINDRALMLLPWFSDLDDRSRRALASVLVERAFEPGQVIFEQNQPGLYCGFVTYGDVRIVADAGPDQEKGVLAELGVGELLGEMALLDGGRRSAGAVAGKKGAVLAALARAEFDVLFNAGNPFAFALMDLIAVQLARRLHHAAEVMRDAALDESPQG